MGTLLNLEIKVLIFIFLDCGQGVVKQWGRGSQGQSLLQRSEWTSLTLSLAVLFATTALVSNAKCNLLS